LLWLVPLDWHDPLFLQVDSLSFHLLQILPVTSGAPMGLPGFGTFPRREEARRNAERLGERGEAKRGSPRLVFCPVHPRIAERSGS
jgi:hypothetical protein